MGFKIFPFSVIRKACIVVVNLAKKINKKLSIHFEVAIF
jgi:hypothetical protein